jgi:hypothetical protein
MGVLLAALSGHSVDSAMNGGDSDSSDMGGDFGADGPASAFTLTQGGQTYIYRGAE